MVILDDTGELGRHLADQLVQLHPNQPCLRAELDAVPIDLLRHAGRHLGALQDDQDVSSMTAFWNSSAVSLVRT